MGVHICNKKQEAANVVPESPIEDAPAHEELLATSPPQASSPETDGVLAEGNLTLKRKLRHAVTVANGCARVLEDERAENSEQIRKLRWALRLERDAHQKKKDNPLGHPLLPTHAQIALAAHALVVSLGRTRATLGDYRECNGVPRLIKN